MRAPAPVAVPTEVRVLDVGARVDRVWRLTQSIGEEGILFGRALPWEHHRPVKVSFRLPDDAAELEATGLIEEVRPDREDEEAAPRAVRFAALDEATRERIVSYVQERMLLP